jgi:hypothetical protein
MLWLGCCIFMIVCAQELLDIEVSGINSLAGINNILPFILKTSFAVLRIKLEFLQSLPKAVRRNILELLITK